MQTLLLWRSFRDNSKVKSARRLTVAGFKVVLVTLYSFAGWAIGKAQNPVAAIRKVPILNNFNNLSWNYSVTVVG